MVPRGIFNHERRYLDVKRLRISRARHCETVLIALQPTCFRKRPLSLTYSLRGRFTVRRGGSGGFFLDSEVLTIEEANSRGEIAKIRGVGNDPSDVEEWLPNPWLGRVSGDLRGAVDRKRANREIVDEQGVL